MASSVSQTIERAYRYRFSPTTDQAVLLHRTFGCIRVGQDRRAAGHRVAPQAPGGRRAVHGRRLV
ncbi:helix-turn-helix domain-containing protein [Nocardiopsis suaedae]|uniref:helix-turn-helix domain-containing protein n=1 Tax=Nocardiopsis suaedae TaxID=3018444 RepID=UPI0038CD6B68